jgi:hypothetical protein
MTPYGGLANRWFQPLTHLSGFGKNTFAELKLLPQGADTKQALMRSFKP